MVDLKKWWTHVCFIWPYCSCGLRKIGAGPPTLWNILRNWQNIWRVPTIPSAFSTKLWWKKHWHTFGWRTGPTSMLLSRSGTFSLCLADELLPKAVVAIFCYFCVAWEMDQLYRYFWRRLYLSQLAISLGFCSGHCWHWCSNWLDRIDPDPPALQKKYG